MTRRQGFWAVLSLMIALGLAAHYLHGYHPRLRPAIAEQSSKVAALLDSPDAVLSFWMPYPHQNLPLLRQELGLDTPSLDAILAFADLPKSTPTSFGALSLPAAHDLGFALAPEHGRMLTADVYPALAIFARLAGRLADNPWLAGGPVDAGTKNSWVQWEGNRWSLVDEGAPRPSTATTRSQPALAIVALHEGSENVPAGEYFLNRGPLGLTLAPPRNEPPRIPWLNHHSLPANDVALVLVERNAHSTGQRVLLFFGQSTGQLQELPRAVSIVTGDQPHWELPGKSLVGLSGRDPALALMPDGQMMALDAASLEQGRRLLPQLLQENTYPRDGHVLWIDLATTAREAQRINDMLKRNPLVSVRTIDQWRQIATICRPLAARFAHLTVVVDRQELSLRFDLARRISSPE